MCLLLFHHIIFCHQSFEIMDTNKTSSVNVSKIIGLHRLVQDEPHLKTFRRENLSTGSQKLLTAPLHNKMKHDPKTGVRQGGFRASYVTKS